MQADPEAHQQLARIRAAAKKAESINDQVDAIKRAADQAIAELREVRTEIDDALSKIQERVRAHANDGTADSPPT